jgi:hypothetical protein
VRLPKPQEEDPQEHAPQGSQEYGVTTMRMVTFGSMVLMAIFIATVWNLTHTTALIFATPADRPEAMNPHEMMKNAGGMPVQVVIDPI